MSKITWLLAGVLCAGLYMSPVMAGDDGNKDAGDRFAKLDANGDGTISLDEFKVIHDRRTAKLKEKLGDKYDPARAPNAEKAFVRLDADQSGSLSREELAAGRDKAKTHVDQNVESQEN